MEHLDRLRSLIREMIEEETLEEFSGVAGAGGFIGPIGAPIRKRSKRDRRKSKIKESKSSSLSGQVVGDEDYTFHNHFRYSVCEDTYDSTEHFEYYDAIDVLARSFGLSDNPFGKNRAAGIKRAMRYLQGEIKYPHEA